MVTINNQSVDYLVVGVNFSFPINCSHTKNIVFNSTNTENSPEFNADVQAAVSAYEYTFKTSPDYSTQDPNLNVAEWNIVMFDGNVGIVSLTFTVQNAVITMNQSYGFPDEMSETDRQASLIEQVNQYEINYKIGNDLVDL